MKINLSLLTVWILVFGIWAMPATTAQAAEIEQAVFYVA